MSNDSFKIKKSINLEPLATPTLDTKGDVGYNSTAEALTYRDNAATQEVVAKAKTQTLTNKTIVAASNTITTAATGNLAAVELNAALAELQTDVDSRAPSAGPTFTGAIDGSASTNVDLATTNTASTIDIGTGSGANTINIGGASSTVNFTGSVFNQAVTNLNVSDKLITVNDGGGAASGGAAGLEVEENAVITGSIKTSADRNSWEILAPNTAGVATLTPGAGATNVVLDTATQTLTNKTIGVSQLSGQVSIANGGTGQATANAGFNSLSPMTTGGDIIYGGASGVATRLANGSSGQFLKSNGGTTAPSWAAAVATVQVPTIQKFTSGSGTYTTPANTVYIRVRMVGAGGGGAGSGTASQTSGGDGGASTFGSSLLTANGGIKGTVGTGAGAPGNGGNGGTASLGSGPIGTAISGSPGQQGVNNGSTGGTLGIFLAGGNGGSSPFFSGGGAFGSAGVTNTGGGGSGAVGNNINSLFTGGGGGSGGFVDAIIASPSATYAYAVGAAGTAGGAGTNGSAGGAGAAGYIEVTEYY